MKELAYQYVTLVKALPENSMAKQRLMSTTFSFLLSAMSKRGDGLVLEDIELEDLQEMAQDLARTVMSNGPIDKPADIAACATIANIALAISAAEPDPGRPGEPD